MVLQCSGSGVTRAIVPVLLLQSGAPLQFPFHLFLDNFACDLQKLTFDLNCYWQTILSHKLYSSYYAVTSITEEDCENYDFFYLLGSHRSTFQGSKY